MIAILTVVGCQKEMDFEIENEIQQIEAELEGEVTENVVDGDVLILNDYTISGGKSSGGSSSKTADGTYGVTSGHVFRTRLAHRGDIEITRGVPYIHPELRPYYDEWMRKAERAGIGTYHLKRTPFIYINFSDMPWDILGSAVVTGHPDLSDDVIIIEMNREHWKYSWRNPTHKKHLFAHEMGHAALNLQHSTCGSTLMNAYAQNALIPHRNEAREIETFFSHYSTGVNDLCNINQYHPGDLFKFRYTAFEAIPVSQEFSDPNFAGRISLKAAGGPSDECTDYRVNLRRYFQDARTKVVWKEASGQWKKGYIGWISGNGYYSFYKDENFRNTVPRFATGGDNKIYVQYWNNHFRNNSSVYNVERPHPVKTFDKISGEVANIRYTIQDHNEVHLNGKKAFVTRNNSATPPMNFNCESRVFVRAKGVTWKPWMEATYTKDIVEIGGPLEQLLVFDTVSDWEDFRNGGVFAYEMVAANGQAPPVSEPIEYSTFNHEVHGINFSHNSIDSVPGLFNEAAYHISDLSTGLPVTEADVPSVFSAYNEVSVTMYKSSYAPDWVQNGVTVNARFYRSTQLIEGVPLTTIVFDRSSFPSNWFDLRFYSYLTMKR